MLRLAALSGTGYGVVIGAYLLLVLVAFARRPRDVYGRRRALGCIGGLVIAGGLLLAAFAAWAPDSIF